MNLEFSFLRVHRHVVELKINKFRTIMQKSDNNLEVDMSMIRIQGGSYKNTRWILQSCYRKFTSKQKDDRCYDLKQAKINLF
jgi:hypothetical protein